MQNVNELNSSIDSLTTKYLNEIKGYSNTVYLRTGAKSISNFKNKNKSVVFVGGYDYLKNFSQRQKEMILVTARNNINMQLKNFSNQKNVFFIREKVINLHRIWRDDKFVTAFSAFIFFIIGAPIGALIKKGGLGLPTVTALIIFLTYHFTGTFLKNSAEDGSLNPLIGAWTMTIIITILAMLIFVRANNDKPLINISNLRLRVFIKK
jgi:lipopolysaccharide export system permease protein